MHEIVWQDKLANFRHDTELTLIFWPWSVVEPYTLEIDHEVKPGHEEGDEPCLLLAYPVSDVWLRTLYEHLKTIFNKQEGATDGQV